MTQTANNIQAALERIEARLDRMETSHWGKAFAKLDMGKLALDLRRERDASFPDQYFSDNAWDILLELYQAHRAGDKLRLDLVGQNAGISHTLVLRYMDIFMQDGFVYCDDSTSDNRQCFVILTKKGLDHLESLFQKFQAKVIKQSKSINN